MAGIQSFFAALIPTLVRNGAIINVFEVMRRLQRLIRRQNETIRIRNRVHNEEVVSRYKAGVGGRLGYIENQNAFSNLRYGKSTVKYSGCEVIATFNALVDLTKDKDLSFPALIAEFERDGMVMAARFGTAPKAVADFFIRHGYATTFSTREEEFDRIADDNDSMILTMYNDRKDIMQEIHSIYISREHGKLVAHNVYGNGRVVGPYASLSELLRNINGGKARGIALVAMKKKEDV